MEPVYPEAGSVKTQLEELNNWKLASVKIDDMPLDMALGSLSPLYYAEPPLDVITGRFVLLDPIERFQTKMPTITLKEKNISYIDLANKIAIQSDCIWWVDRDICFAPKKDFEEAQNEWRTRRSSQRR